MKNLLTTKKYDIFSYAILHNIIINRQIPSNALYAYCVEPQ